MKHDTTPEPSPEISNAILYEHEMIRQETKTTRIMLWGLGSIATIFTIYLATSLIYVLVLSNETIDLILLPFFSLIIYFMYLCIKSALVNDSRIKLTITDNELLIRAPRGGIMAGPEPLKLNFSISEVVDVSIRHPRSPELEPVMSEGNKFKLSNNQNLYPFCLIHRSCYTYLLSLSGQPFPDNTQFLDIEFHGGWKVLVEFNDTENLVNVLKQRISQRGKSI